MTQTKADQALGAGLKELNQSQTCFLVSAIKEKNFVAVIK